MGQYAVISDIHGNLYALEKIMEDMNSFSVDGVILLGDLIDYGMQSNETIEYIQHFFPYKIVCNIWGNHEQAVMHSDFTGFSSKRGAESAMNTALRLTDRTRQYLNMMPDHKGIREFVLEGLKCLAVHGSAEDPFWKAIAPDDVRGDYTKYDFVFSGHSHYPHIFTKFYDADDLKMRNRHAVTFINPGSAGQPRNHNPCAQYMILDILQKNIYMRSVPYDVEAAMSLFDGSVDWFYRDRLKNGI